MLAPSAGQVSGQKPLRARCSCHRWWRPWAPHPFLKASMHARLLSSTPDMTSCSPCLLSHPHLVWVGLPSYPLAFTHTACCQVLAINALVCCPLNLLSTSPHHMLGCEHLDLLSGSPRSPPDGPPPLRLPSLKWRWSTSVGAQMRS
jgi:hypothetical protein